MQQNILQKLTFISIFLFIFSFAWYLQSLILVNVDVSWLLEASKRMLAGGSYTKDYFDNNPPWILYFYVPPVLLAKVSNIAFSIRSYVFALSFISLTFSYYFFKQILSKEDIKLARLLTVILAILFLIFPADDFAQRDHLFFILSLPYFLMVYLRLQGHKINPYLAFFIGVFAGSGFIIKPYFLAPLIFVELYYLLKLRIAIVKRPEIYSIILLLIIYAAILFLRHPDYIHVVMPYAMKWCYAGTRKPWPIVFNNQWTEFCYLTLLLYFATYEINRYKQFTTIMLLVFAGFFAAYVMQQEDWPYHLKPTFFMALFLDVLFFNFYINAPNAKKYISILMLLCALLLMSLFNLRSGFLNYNLILHPILFFGLMFFVYIFIIYQIYQKNDGKKIRYLTGIVGSLLIGYLFCYFVIKLFAWTNLFFVLTGLVLVLSFAFLIASSIKDKIYYAFITIVGTFIFFLPYYLTYLGFDSFQRIRYQKLENYLEQNASGKSVYFFVTNLITFPIISHSNINSSSRFSFFWPLPGMVKQSYISNKLTMSDDTNYLINMVAEDLNKKTPKFVFIDALPTKASLYYININKLKLEYIPFEYLSYFGSNQNFHLAWANYHYLTTLTEDANEHINPLRYSIILEYQNYPSDDLIKDNMVYMYICQDGSLEVAVKKILGIERIKIVINSETGINENQYITLKKILSSSGMQLDTKSKNNIMTWLSKQTLHYPLYSFKVYQRIT